MKVENMNNKKLLFVFNPLAGKAQIKNHLMNIIDTFVKYGYEVTVFPTQGRLDAYNIIKEKASNYDLVVCSGGDGTLNESIKGMMTLDNKPLLGYIPAGTTNDFAYSLGIPKDMEKAAENIMTGIPFSCDIGSFNNEHFAYVAAFGAFTDVTYETPQQAKKVLGHAAYVIEGIKRLSSIRPYHIRIEYSDNVIEGDYILGLVTNSISIGGYRKLNDLGIILDDGLFEVTLVKPPKNAFDLQGIITSVLNQKFDSPYIDIFKASEVTITCDELLTWTLDGEDGGGHTVSHIINNKQAVNILIKK
jgi:diacylglycerol kinase (ATP)